MYREATETINGRTYRMRTLPASEAIDLMKGLGKYLPEKILHILILAQVNAKAVEDLKSPKVLAAMLAAVYGHQPQVAGDSDPSKDLSHWARECFKYCTVDPLPFGKDLKGSAYEHFDELFSGDLGELVEVLLWLLPANFTKPSISEGAQNGSDTQEVGESAPASSTLPPIVTGKQCNT